MIKAAGYDKTMAARLQHGYVYDETNGVGFYRSASLKAAGGVCHGFSARRGGISKPPYDSLNLGLSRPEPPENMDRNFHIFADAAGFSYDSMAIVNYEHGARVLAISAAERGRGFGKAQLPFCDGLVTNDPEVTLITSHADCGAYFVYDPKRRAVGLAHAGWKGTLARIGAELVRMLAQCYGSEPKDLLVSTGPCICRDCFEVDMELAKRFESEFGYGGLYSPGRPQKAQLDLETPAAIQFLDMGVKAENINLMNACTYHMEHEFFSYRRDGAETGSMAAYIRLI